MQQLDAFTDTPRARNTDPETSHVAAVIRHATILKIRTDVPDSACVDS